MEHPALCQPTLRRPPAVWRADLDPEPAGLGKKAVTFVRFAAHAPLAALAKFDPAAQLECGSHMHGRPEVDGQASRHCFGPEVLAEQAQSLVEERHHDSAVQAARRPHHGVCHDHGAEHLLAPRYERASEARGVIEPAAEACWLLVNVDARLSAISRREAPARGVAGHRTIERPTMSFMISLVPP